MRRQSRSIAGRRNLFTLNDGLMTLSPIHATDAIEGAGLNGPGASAA